MDKEVWRDVVHYENEYTISNYGRLFSKITNQIKRPSMKENGYLSTVLYKNGRAHNEYIHRLVALAFVPNPSGLPQVNHKDENKQNNFATNLEWCDATYNNNYGSARIRSSKTRRENGTDAKASERWRGDDNPSVKNPKVLGSNSFAKKVVCDGKVFECIKSCAEYYGVNYSTMRWWLSADGAMPKYFVEKHLRYWE